MEYFHHEVRDGVLHCENVPVENIARKLGTPTYVYSRRILERHFALLRDAFDQVETLVCYSVKSLPNLAVCQVLREMGAGFDVVSGGELFRALQAGAHPRKIVFAGVGKSAEDIEYALDSRILMFNVESEPELRKIDLLARMKGVRADVALRINPDVDPHTHRHITTGKKETKFGIDLLAAERLARETPSLAGVRLIGVHAHIGSQITETAPYTEALEKTLEFAGRCRDAGNPVEWVNIGGGFGIDYVKDEALPASSYAEVLQPLISRAGYRLAIEPGRFIVGNAGILLTSVLYVKETGDRRFVILDAGMNDLLRPALYGARHAIWPARCDVEMGSAEAEAVCTPADIVGPVCETADCFARDLPFPPVREGDLLAIFSAGAYGMAMASNYNGRPRPAEVLVSGDYFDVIRMRETWDDLIRGERKVARWD